MSFVNHLYVGHFEHESGHVRLAPVAPHGIRRPVVRRPLDPADFAALLPTHDHYEEGRSEIPSDWNLWFADGTLICGKYEMNPEAVDFLSRLVQATGCEILDFNTGAFIAPSEIPLRP